MFEEDEDLEDPTEGIKKTLRKKAKEDFIEGCYHAYSILEKEGKKALTNGELQSICRAINRMMSLFLIREEYERCSFLKKYVEKNIPGHVITPDPHIPEELKD